MTTPTRTARASWRRRAAAAGTVSLLALTLAACGDDGDGDGDQEPASGGSSTAAAPPSAGTSETAGTETPDATDGATDGATDSPAAAAVPTEDELAAAVLTPADLPAGFTEVPEDGAEDDDDAFDGTCFGDVGEFSDALGAEPDVEVERELSAESEEYQTFVSTQLEAYADPTAVGPAFEQFTQSLQSCTEVATTDPDGITYDLQLSYDTTVDLPGAQDQLGIEMTGTISSADQTFPLTYRVEVAFTGRFITLVGTYAVGPDGTGAVDATHELAVLQAERVQQAFG